MAGKSGSSLLLVDNARYLIQVSVREYQGFVAAVFSHGGSCGIRDNETDWLALDNALVEASSSRRRIER
jgi:hypothetical protein